MPTMPTITDDNYYHTPFILDNLHKAYKAIALVPEEELNLRHYMQPGSVQPTERNPCGAHYCAFGELTLVPHFQDLGFALKEWKGEGQWYPVEPANLTQYELDAPGHYVWLNRFFGPRAWARLFDMRGNGTLDNNLFATYGSSISDKELALARIKRQIQLVADYPIPADPHES